jgi:hypothetical protein
MRLTQAQASASDALGSRWLWLFLERSTGGGFSFGLILNEIVGMMSCIVAEGTRRRHAERVDEIMAQLNLPLIDIPVDYAHALLAEAVQQNQIAGFSLPAEFQTFRTLLGDLGDPPERALIYEHVSAAEIRLDPSYLAATADLLNEPEISRWFLDFHEVRPFAAQIRQADTSLLVVREQSQQERLERIESEAIQVIFTDERRQAMQRRLEEIAYVFWATDRQHAARLAVAAAIGLEQPLVTRSLIIRVTPGPSSVNHPLIVALLRMSLEMANEIELSGMASTIPHRTPYDRFED